MISFKGYPDDGGLYVGYNIMKDGQRIGSIDVCGNFHNNEKALLTTEESKTVKAHCKRVYEMPSEYGVLGVGESPTVPFDQC